VSSDTRERPESGSIEETSFGDVKIDVTTYISEMDGATVVEIDTSAHRGRLRVYVNEGPVFDQDPEEHGPHGECGYMFQDKGGELHRCVKVGPHYPTDATHRCRCGVVVVAP
jgi:hypothetical protein